MNLYLISYEWPRVEYDVYDAAVVAAESEEKARATHPSGNNNDWHGLYQGTWAPTKASVNVRLIGTNAVCEAGVVVASFNAG